MLVIRGHVSNIEIGDRVHSQPPYLVRAVDQEEDGVTRARVRYDDGQEEILAFEAGHVFDLSRVVDDNLEGRP